MKITKSIYFKNFKFKKLNNKIFKSFKNLIENDSQLIHSLNTNYKNSYAKKIIFKFKRYSEIKLIGMGGSILGARSIYSFLKYKIKKNFTFIDTLNFSNNKKNNKKKCLNLIISKSGNTLETITNVNILIKDNQKNIFITQNTKSYLMKLATKLKADIVHHNNFIGGRYSVLSEVGMLPAELMGLNPIRFKQLNCLIV